MIDSRIEGAASNRGHCKHCSKQFNKGERKLIIRTGPHILRSGKQTFWDLGLCKRCGAETLKNCISEMENTMRVLQDPEPLEPVPNGHRFGRFGRPKVSGPRP